MSARIASFLALCLLMSIGAAAQSLGDVARKERERREKNKDSGVVVREISEDEIFEDEDEEEAESDNEASDGEEGDDAGDSDAPGGSPLPDRIDVGVEPDATDKLEEESRARRQQEAEWRSRFHDARQRVTLAREQKAVWDGVTYVEGLVLVDENGNVVVDSRDDLHRYVTQANRELEEAERSLRELEEQARRAGVPRGWLR